MSRRQRALTALAAAPLGGLLAWGVVLVREPELAAGLTIERVLFAAALSAVAALLLLTIRDLA